MKSPNHLDSQFEFSDKLKMRSLCAIMLGIFATLWGFSLGHAERIFANLLLMAYYSANVCMAAVFFCAVQYVAQAGWSASLIRIPQAFAKILPVAAVILFVVIALGLSFQHMALEAGHEVKMPYLYKHWARPELINPTSAHFDKIISGKSAFLNIPFFLIRLVVFLGLYSFFGHLLVQYSRKEDVLGGMNYYCKSFKISAIFLVIFGFTIPILAFDVIMSLEAHWFSTIFGWYNFAAMWITGLAAITLVIILLKKQGYLSWITENHLHDLGKLVFAFSIFWTYLWFGQLLLIYYANLPEESVYFYKRWAPEFKPWFWLNIVLNFAAPLLILMTRAAKRTPSTLKWLCITLLLGHWLDYYLMIMPGTVGAEGRGFGIEEIGIALGFLGLFSFLVLDALKDASLLPKHHPFLEESLHHHI